MKLELKDILKELEDKSSFVFDEDCLFTNGFNYIDDTKQVLQYFEDCGDCLLIDESKVYEYEEYTTLESLCDAIIKDFNP